MTLALALDVGGTKLAAGLVDHVGTVVASRRTPTPNGPRTDAEALLETVAELLQPFADSHGDLAGIGVGCGGPMQWPAGLVSPLNIPAWRDFPLREKLAKHFDLAVRLHNDAICLAIAEHWLGAGRGQRDMIGMVVSTGVGGGLILGGHLVDGASGNAGHIGHIVVEPDGSACSCGGFGCLEAIASGPRLAAWAVEQGWRSTAGDSARELTADARAGHPIAVSAMKRAGNALGVAIASATNLCDVRLVTVGGGLSQAGAVLFDPLRKSLKRHATMGFSRRARVVSAGLGQHAGLVGAAALIHAGDRYWNGNGAGRRSLP